MPEKMQQWSQCQPLKECAAEDNDFGRDQHCCIPSNDVLQFQIHQLPLGFALMWCSERPFLAKLGLKCTALKATGLLSCL